MTTFTLSYTGSEASHAEIDFYDAARAMLGFQRSLALTVHLVQNGEIITQATSLKNGRILALPPRQGSWEIIAGAVFTAAGGMALAPKDSVAGHLARSIYDYILNATLGIDVDFDSTIRLQHEGIIADRKITESKLDSLLEKTQPAIVDMHRPIVFSESARRARIRFGSDKDHTVGPALTPVTYEHATVTKKLTMPQGFEGIISSYNSNTYKGRIYLLDEKRPVSFELADTARDQDSLRRIAASLTENVVYRGNYQGQLAIKAFRHESSTGILKSLYVVQVADNMLSLG